MDNNFIGRRGGTPEQEDRALFKTYGGPIEVEMVPSFQRPDKHLFMVKAFFQKEIEIIAIFSGRRALETDQLKRTLSSLESLAAQRAAARKMQPPPTDMIRLPVQIKGSWQQKFYSDDEGQDVKVYQLLVARWAFNDLLGQPHQFGEAPAYDIPTRKRAKSRILQRREIDAVQREWRPGTVED